MAHLVVLDKWCSNMSGADSEFAQLLVRSFVDSELDWPHGQELDSEVDSGLDWDLEFLNVEFALLRLDMV